MLFYLIYHKKIELLTKGNIDSINKIKDNVSDKLVQLQKDNAIQLEKMRIVVDEKLQSTLEKRLDSSFKIVSDRLEKRVKLEAKTICDKYINPPHTTDFAIMFLPTEGLYSEVLKIPGFFEHMQKNYRVIIAGLWTLAAILNSLRLGFKTLAIEKRSSEVWKVLGTIKTEFGKFGDLLEKTHKKLNEASKVIDSALRKSRTIERTLGRVEMNPHGYKINRERS